MTILDQIAARPRLSDAEWAMLEFGAVLGETPCKGCGELLAMEHQRNRNAPTCEHCDRPWDCRCHGWHGADGGHSCEGDGWARPAYMDRVRHWLGATCLPCEAAPQRAHRMAQVPQVFAGLGDELALTRDGAYRQLGHRQALQQALGQWSRKALLVWGPCGSGKSVAVLRWAIMQHVAGASVVWVRSRDIVRALKRSVDRDEGAELLRRVARARVLVIDEFQAGNCSDWTSNVGVEMGYIIQDRLDGGGMRTVLVANRPPADVLASPADGGALSQMVLSRWQSAGRVVQCGGDDLRNSHD